MFQLRLVTKTYQRRGQTVTALNQANLEISSSDFIAITGPSGSGKTTLLSLLGGMLAPTAGEVLVNGQSLYRMSVSARARLRGQSIGFVFQTFNLIPWLTALENVQIPLALGRRPVKEQRDKAMELLQRVGLSDRMDHRPGELSQGQQQRVALARTLVNDPQLILADEPTGNLDPVTRRQVMKYLRDFHLDGRTIVMVTHDEEAASYAHRHIRLTAGVMEDVDERTSIFQAA